MGDWSGQLMQTLIDSDQGPQPDENHLEYCCRAPNGEGFAPAWARAGEIIESISRPAVLFTHGMTSRLLRTRAMGWGPDRLH